MRPIDADVLKTDLTRFYDNEVTAKRLIDEQPTIYAVPVVHGRWITNKYGETVCSECDKNALQVLTGCLVNRHFEPHKSKFCPNCGARMDEEAKT